MATAQHQLRIIERLSGAFPPPSFGNAEDRARDFVAATRQHADEILTRALENFIAGRVTSHNAAFLPTPAQFGAECIRLSNLAAESAERTKRYTQPQLPPPDIEHSPESRARVQAMLAEFLGKNAPPPPQDAGIAIAGPDLTARTQNRFEPSQDPEDVKKRLLGRL